MQTQPASDSGFVFSIEFSHLCEALAKQIVIVGTAGSKKQLSSAPSSGPTPGLWTAPAAPATFPSTANANGAQEKEDYDPEEEVTQIPGWAPSVSLEVKDYVATGEESEEELYSQRSKLLRFVEGEWKERGTGDAKILRHVESRKCRFLMRQEKTSKIVANHYIIDQKPYCELVHNAGNAKIWVWTALDFADEEQKMEKFALRFKTEELAEEFAVAFLAAKSGDAAPAAQWQEDEWVQALLKLSLLVLAIAVSCADLHVPGICWNCSANSKCLGLNGDCCPTPNGRLLECCEGSEAVEQPQPTGATGAIPPPHLIPGSTAGLGPACANYLQAKGLTSPEELALRLQRCSVASGGPGGPERYAPKPEPDIPGATDRSSVDLRYCRYDRLAVPVAWPVFEGYYGLLVVFLWPHFNWVVGTCERNSKIPNATFCDGVPSCAREPQINYAAAYQYNGTHFIMQDASTAGDISSSGVAGSFKDKTGWESVKSNFKWDTASEEGGEGDWPTKYAPWGGVEGPRGLTPPAALWVLSVDSFYYGTLYMLSQLTLNAQGHKEHNNCWEWEFDAIEGLLGTVPKGSALPGNLNQLYVTATAQVTGCMPMPGTAQQGNGRGHNFTEPKSFERFCHQNPSAVGCKPWTAEGAKIFHGGGHQGTDRFENLENTPYVFAVVLDRNGFWVYRWRPDETGATGWPGISQTSAARVLPSHPRRILDPKGLKTDVSGDTPEAVILIPSLLPEAACTRSSPERVDFRWGASALGSMGYEMKDYKPGEKFQGAQNWWAHFVDTHQLQDWLVALVCFAFLFLKFDDDHTLLSCLGQSQDYPLSIAGVPASDAEKALYSCNKREGFGRQCSCKYGGGGSRRLGFLEAEEEGPHFDAEAVSGTYSPEKGCLAALAQEQASSGWRCDGCRLVYGDQVIDCSICETARPGYEAEVAAAKTQKGQATQNAMAAFLGTGAASAAPTSPTKFHPQLLLWLILLQGSANLDVEGPKWFQEQPATTPSIVFGCGASSSASSTGMAFGVAPASGSSGLGTSSIFGSGGSAPSQSSIFGAGAIS
eukprot:s648_g33.t1